VSANAEIDDVVTLETLLHLPGQRPRVVETPALSKRAAEDPDARLRGRGSIALERLRDPCRAREIGESPALRMVDTGLVTARQRLESELRIGRLVLAARLDHDVELTTHRRLPTNSKG